MPNPSFPKTRIARCVALSATCLGMFGSTASAQTLYDFGNPSADEQYSLELINRARANPPAEGARMAATTDPDVVNAYDFFNVDLALMQSEFNGIAAAPPLAPNAKLTTTARNHSNWMFTNNVQQHDEGTITPWQRVTNVGYNWSITGENIYASSKSVWYAHAGFQVDWGYGTGGMQSPRGHRDQIHDPSFREIGVGITYGTKSEVGPLLVTQDFGTQQSTPNFGTGVAYYDLNSNNFYDPGEGISGLTVNVNGSSHYCTTASGGGWAVPIPMAAATRTVSFTGLNINQNVNLVVPDSENAKADLKLTYNPPAITSTATAYNSYPHTLQFNAVGGATSYKWNRWNSLPAPSENCESTSGITTSTSAGYSVLCTTTKQQGAASFHLATPAPPVSQSFELNSLYFGGTSPSISFQSRLGYAATTEHAKVQVKEEGGTWVDVYNQAGSGTAGETSFTLRNAALTSMAGKAFRVRFLFSFTGGSYYSQTTDNVGWLIDAINFTNVSTLTNNVQTTLATNSGSFTPAATGTYLMSVAPVISGIDFPAGYQTLTVTSGAPPTAPSITTHPASVTINSGSTATLSVTASGSGLSYQWYQGASGTTTTPVGTNSTSFTTPALTSSTSYWVKVSNTGGSANSNTATVTVNPPTVTVTASPASTPENSTTNLVYTFTRTGPTTSAMTVNFSVAGTATLSTDYTSSGAASFTSTSGTVTIPSGAASATVTVDPVADTTVESDETVVLTVSAGSGYTAGSPSAATGTIANDDFAPPSITSHPSSTTINSGSTATLSVTASGSGLSYQWYQGTSGTTTTPVGTNSSSFTTPALTSTTSYWVRITNTGGSANSNTATVTVNPPTVTVSASPASTPENSTTNLVYTFTRTGPTTSAMTVNFSVAGTATLSTDYTSSGAASFTSTSGTVTIPSGAASATVTVDPVADTTVESDETVVLTVSAGSGYTAGSPSAATGTIANDDTSVSVSVSPSSTPENSSTNLVYTFTRTGPTTSAMTVNFSVAGTATLSTDYTSSGAASFTSTSGTVTIPSGAASATVTVDPVADTTVESDETVVLTVSAGSGYTAGSPSAATGTIANDDISVSVSVSPASTTENSSTNLVYTFTRTGPTTSAMTVNFSVAGTATLSTDYTSSGAASFTATSGTVTIPSGAASATVTVDPVADTTVESDETVVLTVAVGSGYTAGVPATATGTIANDDFAPPSITSHPASTTINSGSTATLSVTASGSGLSYQWYQGASGTTTTPVGTNSSSFTTPALTSSASYWVRVTNTGGSANSNAASVTVILPSVAVTASPASALENAPDAMLYTFTRTGPSSTPVTVSFAVAGTATPTTDYTPSGAASFTSTSGTVTIPSGAASATVTVDPVADTTVESDETVVLALSTGSGYTLAPANTATGVIVNDDIPPTILCQPVSTTVKKNEEQFTLSVQASGPGLTYQWYQGNAGTTTNPITGATGSSFTTPTLSAKSYYWVRVSNSAGSVNSVTSTISTQSQVVTRTFASWAGELEAANGLTAGTLATKPHGDHDRDGRSNLIECAFGGNPIVANDTTPGLPKIMPSPTHLIVEYTIRTNLGISVFPETSSTLENWTAAADAPVSTAGNSQTRRATVPRASGPRAMIRMRVVNP